MISCKQLLSFVAFASVLLLDHKAKVYACSCGFRTTCELFEASGAVVHGIVMSTTRPEEPSTTQDFTTFTYNIDVTTLYKGDLDVSQEIEVTTVGSGSICGVSLNVGEEYLVNINVVNGELSMNLCGLQKVWSSVSDEDKAELETSCIDDPCDFACQQFQECIQYEENEQWYCSDTCDDDPCDEDQQCKTRDRRWCRKKDFVGCPQKRRCR